RGGRIAEPGMREGAEAHRAEKRIEEPGVRLEDALEDDRDDDQRHDDRHEEERAQQGPRDQPAVQQQREEEAEPHLERAAPGDEDDRVERGAPEDFVARQRAIVLEADERPPAWRVAVPLVKAEPHRVTDRVDEEGRKDHEGRPHERVSCRMAPPTAPGGDRQHWPGPQPVRNLRAPTFRESASTDSITVFGFFCPVMSACMPCVTASSTAGVKMTRVVPVGWSLRNSGYKGSFSDCIW